jgi:hypothetical protein
MVMMMPPSIVVPSAPAPAIMVTSAAVMTPTMTVAVATFHLDNGGVSAGKPIRVDARQCRRWQDRSKCKSTGRKADQRKPLHDVCPPGSAWARSSVMRQSVRLFHGRSNTTRLESDAGACCPTRGFVRICSNGARNPSQLGQVAPVVSEPLESEDDDQNVP